LVILAAIFTVGFIGEDSRPQLLSTFGLVALLAVAGGLNVWRLWAEDYPNAYYAATVRSMLTSWHAFFFASFDPGGFVSVDKPPLGFWVQSAAAKLFGFHPWSLLLPEAVAGVLSVALVHHLVRRAFGPLAGLAAGLGLAVTPVAVAVSRNTTIDSLLVFTLLLAAWATLRATETGRLRWLLVGMALVGLGFNIKMLQAYLVLPALVGVYLLAAPRGWWTRVWHLAVGGLVLIAVSFAWVVAVDLTPAAERPYVGSSQHNSALELALGYNGLQRLLGRDTAGSGGSAPRADTTVDATDAGQAGATAQTDAGTPTDAEMAGDTSGAPRPDGAGGGPGGNGENGTAGPLRLFNAQLGGQTSWLVVPAVLGFGLAMWQTGIRRRRDRRWQSVMLWGPWLAPAAAFFSVAGYFHRYYLVMLAPPAAALAGIGLAALWHGYRRGGWQAWLLPVALFASAGVQAYLLRPYPDWSRWLTPLVVGLSVAAAAALVLARLRIRTRLVRPVAGAALALGLMAVFVAPAVWSVETARLAAADGLGGIPGGGPAAAAGFGRQGPMPGGAPPDVNDDGARPDDADAGAVDAPPTDGPRAGEPPDGMPAGMPDGGMGGQVDQALLSYLEANRDGYTFLFATTSQQTASSVIIETGEPVMAMGGFLGSDPILTVDGLARDVSNGTVRYFVLGGGGGGQNSDLTNWIKANATLVPASAWGGSTTGGVQVYEATTPTGG
jgi:4-amino-4-deoxy-L-arabinose transferase-like glycosyltransferase